jgi:hypothetical protein
MKTRSKLLTACPTTASEVDAPCRTYRKTVLVRCLTPLCVAAVLCTAALQANADTAIYLYVNGNPVNVTATYSVQTNHVYDSNDNLVGTVNGSDQILNASGQVIGYLQISGD